MKEAIFYKKIKDKAVQCQLCPHFCFIKPGKRGKCGVRENKNGKLCSLVYGRLCSTAVDAIEKKPLFHFAPGTQCLSIATVGCNLSCSHCQNWNISHPPNKEIVGEEMTAKQVVEMAKENKLPGIAYTYTEPLIALEFYLETMKLARKAGLYNIWVSNGYINPKPLKKAAKYLDAVNVDLKGDSGFYKKVCGVPDNRPVLEALKLWKKLGVFLEVTNLLIPGHNDKDSQIKELVLWVKKNLGVETPLHFSAYYPCYKLKAPPTPEKTLERAWGLAKKAGMLYVYVGNVFGHDKESTYCPKCGEVAIKRTGYHIESVKEVCDCGEKILLAGKRWMK